MNKYFLYKKLLKAACMIGCFFFSGCENDQKTIDDWMGNKAMVEEANNIETFLSQSGKMRAKLWAPFMLRYQADTLYVEFPKTLHVNFFDSTGKAESHLDSKYGKYFESLNKVYLRDSVVAFNVQGDTLRTEELWWDQATQKFFTDKNVRIRKDGNIFFGKGMEAKQDLTDINIKQLTGTFYAADSLAR